jgi:hypothetical protein
VCLFDFVGVLVCVVGCHGGGLFSVGSEYVVMENYLLPCSGIKWYEMLAKEAQKVSWCTFGGEKRGSLPREHGKYGSQSSRSLYLLSTSHISLSNHFLASQHRYLEGIFPKAKGENEPISRRVCTC